MKKKAKKESSPAKKRIKELRKNMAANKKILKEEFKNQVKMPDQMGIGVG